MFIKNAVCLLLIIFFIARVVEAEEHSSSPVMVNNQKDNILQGNAQNQYNRETIGKFKVKYELAKKPSFVVFWGKKYDDILSEWQSSKKFAISNRILGAEDSENSEPRINNNLKLTDAEKSSGKSRKIGSIRDQKITAYQEEKIYVNDMGDWFDSDGVKIKEGFLEVMLNIPVIIKNRSAIMRLAQREYEKKEGDDNIDLKKIETDSLKMFVDYLIEVTLDELDAGSSAPIYKVKVISMHGGQVVAFFHVDNVNPIKEQTGWKAADSGYERTYATGTGHYETGKNIAIKLMEKLNRIL